jgi:hypothetical protein
MPEVTFDEVCVKKTVIKRKTEDGDRNDENEVKPHCGLVRSVNGANYSRSVLLRWSD